MKYKVLYLILKYTYPFLLLGVIYLIGVFIAMDWNPTNWFLYTTVFGRILSLGIATIYIGILIEAYTDN